jgi:hypothetical protein
VWKVSEERIASIFRAKTISELTRTLAATSSILQEPHGITIQMTSFFRYVQWSVADYTMEYSVMFVVSEYPTYAIVTTTTALRARCE